MARQIGRAGKSVRKMESERFKKRLEVRIILLILVWVLLFLMLWFLPQIAGKQFGNAFHVHTTAKPPLSFLQSLGFSFLFTLFIGIKIIGSAFFKKVDKKDSLLKIRQHQAARGAAAEETVGEILKGLPSDFIVLHDIPSPYGNIDHIAVSENHGVFVIETKSHTGKVTTDGKELFRNGQAFEKDAVSQVLKNAFWLRGEIKRKTGTNIFVTPILVFTNAFVTIRKPVRGVLVVNKRHLLETILNRQNKVKKSVVEYFTPFGRGDA